MVMESAEVKQINAIKVVVCSLIVLVVAASGSFAAASIDRTFDPNEYTAEQPVRVCIAVEPDTSTEVYAVEDSPPTGWTVDNINESGAWDSVNKKVKWGPFFDNQTRTLCYDATPPSGESGLKTFNGIYSADGADTPIAGEIDSPCIADVPDVLGMSEAAAETALNDANLVKGSVTYENSDTVAAGLVIDQDPNSGTSVPCDSEVDLIVSLGPCMADVPDVVGLSEAAAETALNDANLVKGSVTSENSDTVAAGLVISQDPTSGTSAPCDSAVDLVISSGPCMTDVPDVLGLSEAAAETSLNANDLLKGTVTYEYSDTVAAGLVLDQDPNSGTSVPCDSQVNLVISVGLPSASRSFEPNEYTPEQPVLVCIIVEPNALTQVYAVEDAPPTGWTVGDINEGGVWDDVNKKVKWGPFFDNQVRTLCYDATPPSGESGLKTFNGVVSADGVDTPIVGQINGGCMTDVPNVLGITEAAAETALNAADLVKGTVTYDYSETVGAGLVMDQDPSSGTSVACESAVNLVISLGPCTTTVPDVLGMTESGAQAALDAEGLVKGTVTHDYSDTVAVGRVMDQDPDSGTSVSCGSTVDLVISDGPPPDLVGECRLGRLRGAVSPGDRIRARIIVTNGGGAATEHGQLMDIEVCVRPCGALDDSQDTLIITLTDKRVSRLRVGRSKKYGARAVLPAGLDAGEYCLVAKIDCSDDVDESNEDNNTAVSSCFEIVDGEF
jgi:beta-lactam-binding protein with PASTA domain